ncbi:MAG: ExeM/NucH family extracellular endonuclease [Actinomycetota bacterium]
MTRTESRSSRALSTLLCALSILAIAAPLSPAGALSPDVVISEVYGGGGNSGATLTHDFIELFNRSSSPVSVSGWSVQYASAAGTTWQVTALSGNIAAGGHYLVRQAQGSGGTTPLPTPDASGNIAMSATSGKVALVTATGTLTCGANCDAASGVRDFVGYGSANDFEGTGAAPGLTNTTSAFRNATRDDTDVNSADFTSGTPNPQNSSSAPPPPPPATGCDVPANTQIAQVQGAGSATPLSNQQVRVEGVVTADFQDSGQLGGFFIQDDTPDADPLTSEGLFVFSTLPVNPGDRVLVNGTAIEFNGLTELSPVSAVDICGTGTIEPAPYELPRPSGTTFEPAEGVLVTFPEPLTATEHFQLGRFGEVTVSSEGRLLQPTNIADPGAPAQALLDEADRRRLLIDDGSTVQNPSTVPYLSPEAVRIGDTASGITGVLSFGFSRYRLQPTAPIAFARTNPRPTGPVPVGGDVTVGSFNALNYFTTLGDDNPNARGADNAAEFSRQQAKEVAAITGLNSDVLGLMEVENNGPTAVGNLVDALNAASGPGTYAFITEPFINPPNEFGGRFGTDAIKVALIYQPAVVEPVGPAQTSADSIFSRPPLVQSFVPVEGGEVFTVVVNHFKSKGCGGATGADLDQGDGQGCFNALRTAQATELLELLDQIGPPNPALVGDLNAYAHEDPLDVLHAAGYTGLTEQFVDPQQRYSFVFDGFSGELDHALAGTDLVDKVTGATIWHINADEPLILDYNTEFNPPGLYQPDAFRSSDHDPLLIGLNLATAPEAPEVSALAGWGAATVSWTEPGNGGKPIDQYRVSAFDDQEEVSAVTLGPEAREHTFGGLVNGNSYRFEVVAANVRGPSDPGTAHAAPFAPRRFVPLAAGVECPLFTATNNNPYPVSVEWRTTLPRSAGRDVVPAQSTIALGAAVGRPVTVLRLFADGRIQSSALARCR